MAYETHRASVWALTAVLVLASGGVGGAASSGSLLDRDELIKRNGLDRIELPKRVVQKKIDFIVKRRVRPVTTGRLRLEVKLPKDWTSGVLKWRAADVRAGKATYHEGSIAEVTTSYVSHWNSRPEALKTWTLPTGRMDRRSGLVHWYPHRGTTEWIDYNFRQPVRVSAVEIYWFDDTGSGNSRLPESWRLLAHDGGGWKPVGIIEPDKKASDARPPQASTGPEKLSGWFKRNIPFFECPDKELQEIYYFRWGVYRKHIKETPDGHVVTEFLPRVRWAGKHNTISCAAGHHFREGRWLRDPRYLDDYAAFWLRKGGALRSYSFWIADSLHRRYLVDVNKALVVDLLPDLIGNFKAWEKKRRDANGLFWQIDDRDGMEVSIGGSGYRATINSYMYAEAAAISKIAELAGKPDVAKTYRAEADRIKALALASLWDERAQFFKVLPRGKGKTLADVRELHGYVPWYFNMPEAQHSAAWKELMDPQGFYAPFGPTTAERRHPRFRFDHRHDCQWNGPSWPYATTQTLVALANLLNCYEQDVVSKQDYFLTLGNYAKSQYKDGKPWIAENLDGITGRWIVDKPRSADYNHSGYCDLVISGLVGLRPRADSVIEVNPLVPDRAWDWFCLEGVPYHGKRVTVLYDRTGTRYRKGKGLRVFADGAEVASSDRLERVTGRLR